MKAPSPYLFGVTSATVFFTLGNLNYYCINLIPVKNVKQPLIWFKIFEFNLNSEIYRESELSIFFILIPGMPV